MNEIKVCFSFSTFLLSLCFSVGLGFSEDEITSLPGLTHNITFRQYSGYLNVSQNKHFHYWFVESQGNPEKDPVVLWLTGGPGCSSMLAMFTENGPFKVSSDGKTLIEHTFSWNRVANVIYLESPAGVGYSYSDNNEYHFSNEGTAEDNYLAIESFFKKFPHLKKNDFYITGESYAGVYIPMLAMEMFRKNTTINLKGLAIGNGYLYDKLFINSRIEFGFSHGLISNKVYKELRTKCCPNPTIGCQFTDHPDCHDLAQQASMNAYNSIINQYNIFDNCPIDLESAQSYTPFVKHITNNRFYSNDTNLSQCKPSGLSPYFNTQAVRKAIHIPDHLNNKWHTCVRNFGSFDAYYDNKDDMNQKSNVIDLIEKYKIGKLIIFNGDLDTACDFIGDQIFVDGLGFEITEKFRKWTVNGVIAGNVQRYKGGLSFMVVRDAGHMVPTDRPEAALKIFEELIGISKV